MQAELLLPTTGTELGTEHAAFRLTDAAVAGKAVSTKVTYADCFKAFSAFCGHNDPELSLQALIRLRSGEANAVLLSFQEDQLSRGLSAATVNLRLASLRSVVKTARRLGCTELFLDVPSVRQTSYKDLTGPTPERIAATLKALGGDARPKSRRDAAMLRVLATVGLRRRELLELDYPKHVDLDNGRLHVWAKGSRETERTWVTCPLHTVQAIRSWLEYRGTEEGPLFCSLSRDGHRGRLSGRALWAIVKRLLGTRTHAVRHTAITTALNLTGGDVRSTRMFSRHKDISILMRYDDCREDRGGKIAALIDTSLEIT